MTKILRWLHADLFHLELDGKRLTVRRHHAIGVTAIAVAVLLVITGAFVAGRFAYPYRTQPAPPLGHRLVLPACKTHVMGGCLPHTRPTGGAADIGASSQGPDLSNNNPVHGAAAWDAIARRNSFAIFKVIEGTGFVDRTARLMVQAAKARGLIVGGYDFLHVCLNSPTQEAQLFASEEKADGLTGARTLPPVGDVEYPSSPACNVRAWLASWVNTVYQTLKRAAMIYTGAWWWQPHVGCWWPAGLLAWVSGYGVSYPYMPCGRTQLDVWQFSDHGWNGSSYADLSTWRDGPAGFRAASQQAQPKPKPRLVCFGARAQLRNRTCVKVRAEVANWSRASASSARALTATLRRIAVLERNAAVFKGRVTYFGQKVRATVAADA